MIGSFPSNSAIGYQPETQDGGLNERSAILEVARSVSSQHQPGGQVLTGFADIVLIEAVPVAEGNHYVGSAWAVTHLAALPGANRFRTYLIAVGLGLAALMCVLLTLFVVRNLQNGVRKIEGGLETLEQDLTSQISTGTDPGEIGQIANRNG